MGDTPTFQSNPYGSFDPSQWQNPYSPYYGKALPWPSQYAGMPTDAMGRPIQPPPGMTLNSAPPQAPAAPAQAAAPSGWIQSQNPWMNNPSAQATRVLATGDPRTPGWNSQQAMNLMNSGYQGGAPAGGGGQAPARRPGQPSYDQVLSMLANPGHVTTPGATVPQAPIGSSQPSPGVLQNFLANWKPASSGPGSGFTQNFNSILRGLQGG